MFFVMLNHPNGGSVPLVDADDAVMAFDTAEQALFALGDNVLGQAYGGKVFDLDEPFLEV